VTPHRTKTVVAALALFLLPTIAVPSRAQSGQGILQQVGFDQNLNTVLPLDAPLRDETGQAVKLRDYFGKRPVILTLVYYECPLLCTQELNGLLRTLKTLSYTPGNEFEIVTLSISPTESPTLANRKKHHYLQSYDRPGAGQGWHFLTGDESSIRKVAAVAGFRYSYNPRTKLYAHPAGLLIATPAGRISRYFLGLSYPARDLRFSLVEAGAGRIGSTVDKLLLLCYEFDPTAGRYTLAIMSVLRVLGVATFLSLATYVLLMVRRDLRRPRLGADTQTPNLS
jgi:protein SCO1/2